MFGYTNSINQSLFMLIRIRVRHFNHGPSPFSDSLGEGFVLCGKKARKIPQESHGLLEDAVHLFDGLITEEDMIFRFAPDPIQSALNIISQETQTGCDREIRFDPFLPVLARRIL